MGAWWALVLAAAAADCPRLPSPEVDLPEASELPSTGEKLSIVVRAVDDEAGVVPGMPLVLEGPGGSFRAVTDAEGRVRAYDLDEGEWTVHTEAARVQGVRVRGDRPPFVRVPGPPPITRRRPVTEPEPGTEPWVRYRRSGCLGPCEVKEVLVTADGRAQWRVDGRQGTRQLSDRQRAALAELVDCAAAMPVYAHRARTDFSWVRLDIGRPGDGTTWDWYTGDERAPYESLERFVRKLERRLGVP